MDYPNLQHAEDGAKAIQNFLRSATLADLPRDMQDQAWDLIAPGQSISFAVAHFAHMVYARQDEVSNDALKLAAACAGVTGTLGIDDMGVDNKGIRMMQAMRRRSGEKAPVGMSWPDAENDPEPRESFKKKVEPDAPLPAPNPTPVEAVPPATATPVEAVPPTEGARRPRARRTTTNKS